MINSIKFKTPASSFIQAIKYSAKKNTLSVTIRETEYKYLCSPSDYVLLTKYYFQDESFGKAYNKVVKKTLQRL